MLDRDRGRPARARACALQPPLYSSTATLNSFFSRPSLSGAPRRLLAVDSATQLSLLALSPHVSNTPAISIRICAVVCDGSAQASSFSVCARFRCSTLLFQASFSIFALPCAIKFEVFLCVLSTNYDSGFRVGSLDLFAISTFVVNAHVHVHVGSASDSHSAILNAGCDGLGHHCTFSNF